MSTLLQFNADQFSSLSTVEFSQQWENVSFEQLWEDEQAFITQFLTLAKGESDIELNLDNVLLAKTNDDRMLERVYGPSIFRENENSDALVLKVGANTFPIAIQNERLIVGYLKGRFQWERKNRVDGSGYDLLTVRLGDSREDDPELYEIGCSLVTNESTTEVNGKVQSNPLFLSQGKLDKLLEGNAALGQFFGVSKSGGGSVFKMQDLPANSEHEVIAIDVTEAHPEYGVSYILRLAGGASVFARGNSATLLKKNLLPVQKHIESGKPCTLKVGTITEFSLGKFTVNNSLVLRQTAIGGSTPKPIQQARPQLTAAPQPQNQEFSATFGTTQLGLQWAAKQGLPEAVAKELYEATNQLAFERQEAGEPMHVNERRQAFIDKVKEYAAANPATTVDVQATPVTNSDVDDIPF